MPNAAAPEYVIERASYKESLERQVNAKIAEGYIPAGGVCADNDTRAGLSLYQALIKPGMGGGRRKTRRSRRS